MGNPGKQQEKEGPPVQSSPRASPGSNGNGGGGGAAAAAAPPLTPKIIPRSETNPYPTTFVQADTSSFKQVVQMLTGSADTAAKRHQAAAAEAAAPPARSPMIPQAKTGPKRPAFKLYERRHSSFNSLRINPLGPELLGVVAAAAGFSPRQQQQPEVLSPSVLDFPSLTLSPVTPLIRDPFTRPAPHPSSPAGLLAEERGIAEKGFYLHPSPRGADPPKLLPLFPVTSPRGSSASPSSRTASP